jgi:aminoglycoside phosphotransferase (APT) family kinase protein
VVPLRGGISHANHLIRVDERRPDSPTIEIVLRRWVRTDWQQDDPEFSPAQEVATYGLLAASEVPSPRLLAVDVEPRECDVPAILLTRAPGEPPAHTGDTPFFVAQLAQVLPILHTTDPERAERTLPPYRRYYERARLAVPAWTRQPELWERAIELGTATAPAEQAAFIHRDYHPGNTLWASRRLSAIVDWSSAMWGPPSVDLAHMRVNLAITYGVEVADAFLDAYRALMAGSYEYDPYWDLHDAVDFLPEVPFADRQVHELTRLEDFVARAVAAIDGQAYQGPVDLSRAAEPPKTSS